MKYQIAICDDEVACSLKITEIINEATPELYDIRSFSDTENLITEMRNKNYLPDIVIMDIVFEDSDGIEAAKMIQQNAPEIKIIYISGHPYQSERIFETVPFSLLLKLIDPEKLMSVLEKACHAVDNDIENTVSIKIRSVSMQINKKRIIYIESNGRKLNIVCGDSVLDIYGKMDDIEAQLSDFCRCHQSFIVNFRYVASISNYSVKLLDGRSLPISRVKYNDVKIAFAKYIGGLYE